MEQYAKNPLVLAGAAGILAGLVSFIDHKVNTEEDFVPDYIRYIKVVILVAICSYAALSAFQINCKGCPLKGQTGGGDGIISGSNSSSSSNGSSNSGSSNSGSNSGSSNSGSSGSSSIVAPWGGKVEELSDVTEQIHTGTPNF